ncbi:MAG: hypothetical protein E7258_00615 [Lachnospiraceae bacterium]|nr:hypothetical protein [Lachnospiraceae bacterium]
MSYTYKVPKRKANRISYRIWGSIFMIFVILQVILLVKGYAKHPMVTGIFIMFLGWYGIYLIRSSFRKQAFDITYRFDEEGLKVTHHYGEKQYTFDDIEFVTMVIADENMIFYILNVKAGKDVYIIPFTNKKELCEKIYEFVNSRIKHPDEDDSQ